MEKKKSKTTTKKKKKNARPSKVNNLEINYLLLFVYESGGKMCRVR